MRPGTPEAADALIDMLAHLEQRERALVERIREDRLALAAVREQRRTVLASHVASRPEKPRPVPAAPMNGNGTRGKSRLPKPAPVATSGGEA